MHVSTFYLSQAAAFGLWWFLIKSLTKRAPWDFATMSVQTRPNWMPSKVLSSLVQFRKIIFGSVIPLLLITSIFDDIIFLRLITAITITLYHLLESSCTNKHGEYPLICVIWCLVIPTDLYSRILSLSFVTNFLLLAGMAKIFIGGFGWIHPNTLKTYLNIYCQSKSGNGPLLKNLTKKFILPNDIILSLFAFITIFNEIILISLVLVIQHVTLFSKMNIIPNYDYHYLVDLSFLLLILMHIGIFLFMSKTVGIAFITVIPVYAVSFNVHFEQLWLHREIVNDISFLSLLFVTILSFMIAFGPVLIAIFFRKSKFPFIESWPFSSISLFMWNGYQADIISQKLMTGDTRLVLFGKNITDKNQLIGVKIVYHGMIIKNINNSDSDDGNIQVHDAVLRLIGFTLLQGGDELLQYCPKPIATKTGKEWNIKLFCNAASLWLEREKRLIEMSTGEPLINTAFVEINDKGRIERVIYSSI